MRINHRGENRGFPHLTLVQMDYRAQDKSSDFALGRYTVACSMAEETLDHVGPIHSVVNYERIKILHKQLEVTKFGNDPEVARIGVLLRRIQLRWYGKSGGR